MEVIVDVGGTIGGADGSTGGIGGVVLVLGVPEVFGSPGEREEGVMSVVDGLVAPGARAGTSGSSLERGVECISFSTRA